MQKIYDYKWKALNRFQQKLNGKSLAESKIELENRLAQKGYSRIKISRNLKFSQQPKTEEITWLIHQMALLIGSTIPIKQSLVIVLENLSNIKLYLWIKEIISSLESGFSFSMALSQKGTYLSLQEIQLIKIAEATGDLSFILDSIYKSRAKSEKLYKKIKKIMFYPVIILLISVSLSLLLLIFIVPQFIELYSNSQKNLPLITEILFFLSQFIQNQFILLIIMLSLFSIIFYLLSKKTQIIKRIKFSIASKFPIFNEIILYSRIIYFCQNCALMLSAKVRLDTILNSFLAEKSQDPVLQKTIIDALNLLKQGYGFADSLNPSTFQNDVIQMIAIGERSANLAEMMGHIGDIYQQNLDHKIDLLSQLLEPILMLIIGFIVGTIIIGLYLPIFDMGAMIE